MLVNEQCRRCLDIEVSAIEIEDFPICRPSICSVDLEKFIHVKTDLNIVFM